MTKKKIYSHLYANNQNGSPGGLHHIAEAGALRVTGNTGVTEKRTKQNPP